MPTIRFQRLMAILAATPGARRARRAAGRSSGLLSHTTLASQAVLYARGLGSGGWNLGRRARPNAPGVSWWARQDSNLRSTGYEPAALTSELRARMVLPSETAGRCHPVSDDHRGWMRRRRCGAFRDAVGGLRWREWGQRSAERATGFEPVNISLEG